VSVISSSSSPEVGDLPVPRPVPTQISRSDRLYRGGAKAVGLSTLLVLVLIGVFLLIKGYPAFRSQGFGFITNTGWQTHPTAHGPPVFGVRTALIGTIVVSVLALILALPVALGSALFISEYAPPWLKSPATALVDLLAAVPSIIYGLWGFAFLSGHMTGLSRWLSVHLGFIPFFHVTTPLYTSSQFIAGTVVALMVVPIITSNAREVFSLAPLAEREAAMALGASRATVIRRVVLPFGRGGLIGAVMLGLGRAMGETIAVAIILSLSFSNPAHILQSGGTTIASLIAIESGAGGKTLGLAALMAAGLMLFVFTLLVNPAASRIVSRSRSAAAVEL
jgi:phosphate transport system permease protein